MSELEQPKAPSAGEPSKIILDDRERTTMQRYLASTGNFPPEFVSWMEEYMRTLLTAGNLTGLAQRVATVGEYKLIAKDLTAQTSLYVWEDAQGAWLYCNGASILGAGYTELEGFMGGTTLPDARGRAPWACGTHVDVDLFDNDLQAEATRTPKHKHTVGTLGISGAPSAGSLATASGGAHTHTITDPGHFHNVTAVPSVVTNSAGGAGREPNPETSIASDTRTTGISINSGGAHTHSITGAPGVGTLGVSGEAGSGMGGSDAVAFVVLGSWLIKAG